MDLMVLLKEIVVRKESCRLLVELEYSKHDTLIDVHWQYVNLKNLTPYELLRLQNEGAFLRKDRLMDALKNGKIGANQPCPCGSQLKYKRCCRSSF